MGVEQGNQDVSIMIQARRLRKDMEDIFGEGYPLDDALSVVERYRKLKKNAELADPNDPILIILQKPKA